MRIYNSLLCIFLNSTYGRKSTIRPSGSGRAIDSETMGRYGKRFTPEILIKEAIERIDYGLKLDGLVR